MSSTAKGRAPASRDPAQNDSSVRVRTNLTQEELAESISRQREEQKKFEAWFKKEIRAAQEKLHIPFTV